MKRIPFVLLFFICLLAAGAASAQSSAGDGQGEDTVKKARVKRPVKHFPFTVDESSSNEYDVTIDLSDPAVITKYSNVFKKNNIPFDGDNFEEVIRQILLQKDPALAHSVITASEEKKVLIGTGNKIYQDNLLNLLKPILGNVAELDSFMQKMDKNAIGE